MSQNKNRSYYHIISLFKSDKKVSSNKMRKALEAEGLPSSQRSIARIKDELKSLGFELEYDASSKTYTLDIEANSLPERIINLMMASEFMQEVSASPKEILQYIDFDKRTVSEGVQHLSTILEAITQSCWVELQYKRYDADTPKTHKVAPRFLKEYNNRWYVLVIIRDMKGTKKDAPILFGLDRIVSVQLLEKAPKNLFQQTDMYRQMKEDYRKTKPFEIFDDMIGVNFSNEPVAQVVLSFEAAQAPYLKAQPWHHSQEIWVDNEEEFRIALYVHPNEDLLSLILAQCGRVKVIEPLSLRNEVVAILKKAVSFYE